LTDRLVPLDESNWRDALRVRVSDEQLPMVADSQPVALVILAKAYVRDGGRRWEPLAYLSPEGTIVAVLALTHDEDIVEVRNLAVDVTRQGTGVGTELMTAVLDWCRAQGSRSVVLTFHPANEVAERLYSRVGFSPTGATRNGQQLWSISLADAPRVE
jgi:GNAT superfamily N-acetyltransferase